MYRWRWCSITTEIFLLLNTSKCLIELQAGVRNVSDMNLCLCLGRIQIYLWIIQLEKAHIALMQQCSWRGRIWFQHTHGLWRWNGHDFFKKVYKVMQHITFNGNIENQQLVPTLVESESIWSLVNTVTAFLLSIKTKKVSNNRNRGSTEATCNFQLHIMTIWDKQCPR